MTRASVRRLLLFAAAAAAVSGATACSALLDWSGFTGGVDAGDAEASTGGDGPATEGGIDAPIVPCGDAGECVPTLPTGWTGPIALYVGLPDAGAAPPCPSGFASTPAFDGSGSLIANPAQCSTCTCGGPTGVTCADPVLNLFVGPNCSQSAASPVPVTATCTQTASLAFSVTVDAPQPMGGSCPPSGSTPTIPAPTWGTVARACSAVGPGACGGGGVCASSPPAPFSPRICVMTAGAAGSCPAGYSFGPQIFYTGVSDARGCAPCNCAPPTGGQCTIGSPAVGVYSNLGCSTLSSTLDAPSGCTAYTPPDPVKLLSTPTVSTPGNCVASGGASVGVATPTGAVSFCCVQ